MGFQAKVFKVGFNVVGRFKGRFCAGEMRVGSEGTEVQGDGVVGDRRDEYLLEKKGIFGISWWVMDSVETLKAEDYEEEESTEP